MERAQLGFSVNPSMPTSSSSSSTIHHSSQFNRKPKNTSAPFLQEQTGNYSISNNMKPQEQHKKISSNGSLVKKEKGVRYKECRKNHAANIGGYAVDGCREFMASGEQGTSAALKCAACNCHRNFHKREVEDEEDLCDCSSNSTTRK